MATKKTQKKKAAKGKAAASKQAQVLCPKGSSSQVQALKGV